MIDKTLCKPNEFGKRLAEAMTDTNTTLDLLEMQTQIHKVTLSKYRRGLGIPKGENLVRIATAMKVSVDWLLFGTGNMYRS